MHIARACHLTRRTVSSLALAWAAATLSSTLLAQTLKPGEYEVVTEMSTSSRPAKTPARKEVRCYTAEDFRDLPARLTGGRTRDCKVASSKMDGATLTFTTECGSPVMVTWAGTVMFESPESFQGAFTIKDSSGGASPFLRGSMATSITARRIGECTK